MYNEEKGGKQNKEIAEGKDFMCILQAIILQSQKKYNNLIKQEKIRCILNILKT
jgi:hypothetical protein